MLDDNKEQGQAAEAAAVADEETPKGYWLPVRRNGILWYYRHRDNPFRIKLVTRRYGRSHECEFNVLDEAATV